MRAKARSPLLDLDGYSGAPYVQHRRPVKFIGTSRSVALSPLLLPLASNSRSILGLFGCKARNAYHLALPLDILVVVIHPMHACFASSLNALHIRVRQEVIPKLHRIALLCV